jgi:hypothetical protein
MHRIFHILSLVFAVTALAGCKNAHINYSLADVRPVVYSPFASSSVEVAVIKDLRYASKKSGSTEAHKTGVYNQGVSFKPYMEGYDEVFRGIPYDEDTSYYIAPDRLYWKPAGPLSDMRVRLAEHLDATRIFRKAAASGAPADYTLNVRMNRFMTLKRRHPIADGLGFLGISALFSSDEIISVDADWTLVSARTGETAAAGKVVFRDVQNHTNFRAKDKPFKLANVAARTLGDRIAEGIAKTRRQK